jgi:hypothetical protein
MTDQNDGLPRLAGVLGYGPADEHIALCKQRALAELAEGGVNAPANAVASVMSDLPKHPDCRDHGAILLMGMLAFGGQLETPTQVREFIEGIQ